MASTPNGTQDRDRLQQQRRALPDQPGVYLFRDARGRVIYVGKAKSIRKRVATHFSNPTQYGTTALTDEIDHIESLVVATEAEALLTEQNVHQAVQAALQHPAARRQVLSLHRDLPRRGLPARLLHARAPPPRARLLRPVLERQARARHARPARQGLPVPLLRGRRARPRTPARRAWTTTSSAAGRPASATSPRRSTARASTA